MTHSNSIENEEYIYYAETMSLCEECLSLVQTKIIFQNTNVYMLKTCKEHGKQKTLISTDIDYFKKSRNITNISVAPSNIEKPFDKGCPYDCGICTEHEQHTAMGIVEVIDDCNMSCSHCIAGSHPGAGNQKSMTQIKAMFEALVNHEGNPDIVMISGGEPTIHPEILDIIQLAYSMPFKHIMLITNGLSISNDEDFVSKLAPFKDRLEIYLQFDSLNSEVLKSIRGSDLRDVRQNAVSNLDKYEIHSTLVCVVKKSLNEFEMNDVIDFALQYKFIRGVTFQPCKITGRKGDFDKDKHYITLSEVRTNILTTSPFFTDSNLIPHPLNPENISIGYLLKKDMEVSNVTPFLFNSNSSLIRYKLRFPYSDKLKKQMYFLPELNTSDINYENLFRVAIVSFLDKFNFCTTSVKRSCIHFVTSDLEIIPLDTYYLLYQKSNPLFDNLIEK